MTTTTKKRINLTITRTELVATPTSPYATGYDVVVSHKGKEVGKVKGRGGSGWFKVSLYVGAGACDCQSYSEALRKIRSVIRGDEVTFHPVSAR